MAGRHDKAGDDPSPGLMLTGPIAIRGLSRGVRGALRTGRDVRHRASGKELDSSARGLVDEGDAGGDSGPDNLQVRRRSTGRGGSAEVDAAAEDAEEADVPDGDPDQADRSREASDGASEARSDDGDGPAGPEPQEADRFSRPADSAAPENNGSSRAARGERSGHVPLRERFGREAIGIVVLVVLALVCAGLIAAVVVKTRNDAALAAREAADYTPPPLTTAGPGAAAAVVAIIGDGSATRSASGVAASQRWPALVGIALDAKVELIASVGAGYTTKGADGDTYVQAAADVPADADVVVFVGGAADASAASIDLAKAATQAYAAAADRAPNATVIAVGPLFVPSDAEAEEIQAVRTALQSSARIADIRWVDPIRSKWLEDVDATGDLTEAVESSIAGRIQSVAETPSS